MLDAACTIGGSRGDEYVFEASHPEIDWCGFAPGTRFEGCKTEEMRSGVRASYSAATQQYMDLVAEEAVREAEEQRKQAEITARREAKKAKEREREERAAARQLAKSQAAAAETAGVKPKLSIDPDL